MDYAAKKDHGEVKDLEMAEQQLRNIHANAVDLLRHLEKHPHCPLLSQAWVQSKVTLSNAYVDSVRLPQLNQLSLLGFIGTAITKDSPLRTSARTPPVRTHLTPAT